MDGWASVVSRENLQEDKATRGVRLARLICDKAKQKNRKVGKLESIQYK